MGQGVNEERKGRAIQTVQYRRGQGGRKGGREGGKKKGGKKGGQDDESDKARTG